MYNYRKCKLTGEIFGDRIVLGEFRERTRYKATLLICQCKCGNINKVFKSSLIAGKTNKCITCRTNEKIKYSPESKLSYVTWAYLRTHRKNKLPETWKDFMNFNEDMGLKPALSRFHVIDKTKPLSKENCIWRLNNE